jgi:hypothetical protein
MSPAHHITQSVQLEAIEGTIAAFVPMAGLPVGEADQAILRHTLRHHQTPRLCRSP